MVLIVLFLSACCLPVVALDDSDDGKLELLLTEGRAAFEDELYNIAEKKLNRYLALGRKKLDPEHMEKALIVLVRSLYEQKKYDKALDILAPRNEWRRNAGDSNDLEFWHALLFYETDEFDRALEIAADLAKEQHVDDNTGRVERLQAWCYLKRGMLEEAAAAFARYEEKESELPERAADLLEWGKALIKLGRIEEGRNVLEKMKELPVSLRFVQEGYYWLGQTLIEMKDTDRAVEALTQLGNNEGAVTDLRCRAWASLAEVYESRADFNNAIIALSNGMAFAEETDLKEKMSVNSGRLLVDMGQLDKGISLLKEFILAHSDQALAGEMQLKIAEALLSAGKYVETVDEYQRYLETFDNNTGQAVAYRGKGKGLVQLGRYAEAAASFKRASNLFKEPVLKQQSLFEMCESYIVNSQYKLADESYVEFLDKFPGSDLAPRVRYRLAYSAMLSGDCKKAEERFNEVVSMYPNTDLAEESLLRIAEIKVTLAETSNSRKAWIDAMDAFNEVMRVYSNGACFAQALLGRGIVGYRLFFSRQALADFERVIADFPDAPACEQAFYMRGMCYYRIARDEEALKIWHEFIELFPSSKWAPEMLFEIAKHKYNEKDYESAEKEFLLLVEKYHEAPLADDALLKAGQCAYRQDEYLRAEHSFARIAKEFPASDRLAEARLGQADTLSRLGDYSAAILVLDEIIKKYPSSGLIVSAWLKKGECQFMLGAENQERYEESMKSYSVVANSSGADRDVVMHAEYKTGRCMEKLGHITEAVEQYYTKVLVPFLEEKERGVWHDENCQIWFLRASRNMADIMESEGEWRKAVNVLERVVGADMDVSGEAKERIKKIRSEHWWLFYY